MVPNHMILGVHITNRMKLVSEVQQLFSEYGCNICTRLGLHDVSGDHCSPSGVVILHLTGEEEKCHELARKLAAIDGVETQEMIFRHPAE